jgi:hypothetical protein
LRRPTLLTPDKLEAGYTTIFVARDQAHDTLSDVAELLKVAPDALERILYANQPLPLARTATSDEAQLLTDRLHDLGIDSKFISDEELGVEENNVIRVRSICFEGETISVRSARRDEPVELKYDELLLLVRARLLTKTTAVKERPTRGAENEILDASEFHADEAVLDLYSSSYSQTFRIAANSFDFSCLGNQKTLLVNENMSTIVQLIQSHAPQIKLDDSYNLVRHMVELVWGWQKATKSDGWRRDGPWRFTVGATTTLSNENQFTRYSRLSYFLQRRNS